MTMPRMRTAERVMDEIKAADPNTEVTLHYIRQLIREEAVPVVCCGRKKLVNADAVIALLSAGYKAGEPMPTAYGTIRRVV